MLGQGRHRALLSYPEQGQEEVLSEGPGRSLGAHMRTTQTVFEI